MSIRGGFDKSSSPPLLAPMDLGRLFRFGTGHWVEGDPVILLTSRHSRISFRSSRVSPLDHCFNFFFFFTIFFQRNRKSFQRIGHQNGLAYNVSLNFFFFHVSSSLVDPPFLPLPRFIRYTIRLPFHRFQRFQGKKTWSISSLLAVFYLPESVQLKLWATLPSPSG